MNYYDACAFSLDQQFLDSNDPEWVFFQREREMKTRLFRDHFGKQTSYTRDTQNDPESHQQCYSRQRYSTRLGMLVPESPQALAAFRGGCLEIAAPENLGAPQAMTTITSHQRTSNIRAHVIKGPLAKPAPNDTVQFLREVLHG